MTPGRLSATLAVTVGLVGCGSDVPDRPTYSGEVAEILHQNCASCHRPEGPGPVPLLTYDDAAPRASLLAEMVANGRMPPWLPSSSGVSLEGARELSEAEKRILVRWAEAGAPRGDPDHEPSPPEWPAGWILGEPDLVLQVEDPFTVPAEGPDLYRNFVMPIPVDRPRWARAVELRPSAPHVTHHATMRVDQTAASRLAAEADTAPGFDEMFSISEAHPPGDLFMGWTPGRSPAPFPRGTAWRVEPGTDFVLQLHLMPMGRQEEVTARVGLYFTDREPTLQPMMIRLGSQTLDIPPGEPEYVIEDTFELPVGVDAVGAYPHAHFLAREMRIWAEPPRDDDILLLEIPRWDFDWQDAYRFADPVPLPAGTVLRIRYTYDNTANNPRNPHDPPERVFYGPSSAEEMAELWLQVITRDEGDFDRLAGAVARKGLADRIEGWEFLLSIDSTDAEAHHGLGFVAQQAGDLEVAERHYRLATEHRPGLSVAYRRLGQVLEERGDRAAALGEYEAAVEALSRNVAALRDVGRLRAELGDTEGAAAALERAVELDSTHVETLNRLGVIFREADRLEVAEARLRQAIRLDSAEAVPHFNLALTLVSMGRAEEGIQALNDGLSRSGGDLQAALSVAWLLATDPAPEVRRPALAVELAAQIRDAAGPHPAILDALAAAHAAAGEFQEAVALVTRGIEVARDRGEDNRIPEMEHRRALYSDSRPYVQRR